MQTDLKLALEELEREWGLPPPRGVRPLPDKLRYSAVLAAIRKHLCPHRDEIQKRLDSRATEAVAIVTDAVGSYVTNLPFVIASLGRCIALIGLERFCANPEVLTDVEP